MLSGSLPSGNGNTIRYRHSRGYRQQHCRRQSDRYTHNTSKCIYTGKNCFGHCCFLTYYTIYIERKPSIHTVPVQKLDLQLKSFAHNKNERGEAEGSKLCQHPWAHAKKYLQGSDLTGTRWGLGTCSEGGAQWYCSVYARFWWGLKSYEINFFVQLSIKRTVWIKKFFF